MPDLNLSHQAQVQLIFYRLRDGNGDVMAEYGQEPHLVTFEVPTAYEWVRIMWTPYGEVRTTPEQLIEWRRYVGMSRDTINMRG